MASSSGLWEALLLPQVVKSDYKRWALYQNVTMTLLNSYYVLFIYILSFFFFKDLIELMLPLFIDEETKVEFNLICSRPYHV